MHHTRAYKPLLGLPDRALGEVYLGFVRGKGWVRYKLRGGVVCAGCPMAVTILLTSYLFRFHERAYCLRPTASARCGKALVARQRVVRWHCSY